MSLTDLSEIKKILSQLNLTPQKRFGQNFLVDETVVLKMLESAQLKPNDFVLEVGPGIGVLTEKIAPQVARLFAVEFDRNMALILRNNETIKRANNESRDQRIKQKTDQENKVQILNQDILDFDPEKLELTAGGYKIIGSIPYQISSPLLHHIISWKQKPTTAVFLMQKEVAEKICATAPHASYLSNFVGVFGKAEIVKNVKPHSFFPPPQVHSAIIKITFLAPQPLIDPLAFSKFLHHGFKNPRKMINKAFSPELLGKLQLDPSLRPENLTPQDWQKIYLAFSEKN